MFEKEYPVVYNHLLKYKKMLTSRNTAETGIRYEWYALQRWGANYWEDFSKQKIVWKRVGSILKFCYDSKDHMALDSTCFAIGNHLKYLLAILNSDIGYYLLQDSPKTGTGDLLISVQAIEPLQIPIISDKEEGKIVALIDSILYSKNYDNTEVENEINNAIYTFYNFDQKEIQQIKHIIDKTKMQQFIELQ